MDVKEMAEQLLKKTVNRPNPEKFGEYDDCIYGNTVNIGIEALHAVNDHVQKHLSMARGVDSLFAAMFPNFKAPDKLDPFKERRDGFELLVFTIALELVGANDGAYPELELFVERIFNKLMKENN